MALVEATLTPVGSLPRSAIHSALSQPEPQGLIYHCHTHLLIIKLVYNAQTRRNLHANAR